MIDKFDGEHRYLSNFWRARIIMSSGIGHKTYDFKSTEHAFQAYKMMFAKDFKSVCEAETPGKAKKLARSLPCRGDWDDVKVNIMRRAVHAKFSQHRDLQQRLLATGNQFLVEGNTWGDTFWGVCDGNGRNMLGHILMEVRNDLS